MLKKADCVFHMYKDYCSSGGAFLDGDFDKLIDRYGFENVIQTYDNNCVVICGFDWDPYASENNRIQPFWEQTRDASIVFDKLFEVNYDNR